MIQSVIIKPKNLLLELENTGKQGVYRVVINTRKNNFKKTLKNIFQYQN